MAQVSGIEIEIRGKTSGLESALGKAETSIARFAKTAAASLAGALSAGVFVTAAKSAIDFADTVGKSAQKIGSTTKALSELEYAARLSDLNFSELETSLRFLSKSMVTNAELFSQLGVSIRDAGGQMRDTDEVLMDLADRFAGMPDSATKTALAMELFGRSGAALIPMLNAGSAGLDQMRQRAIDLGLSISDDTAKRAEQFNDTLTDLAAVGRGAMVQLASAMLPVAQAFLNVSVAGAEAMVKLGGAIQDIAPYVAVAAAGIAGFYAPAVLAGLGGTASGFLAIGTAIRAVTVAMMANPIGLLVGGLAAATVAVFAFRDDLKDAFGGVSSAVVAAAGVAVTALAAFYAPAVLSGIAATSGALGVGLVGAIRAVTAAMMANPLGLLVAGLAGATVAVFAFRDDIKNALGVDVVGIAKDVTNYLIRGFLNTADLITTAFLSLPDAINGAFVGMANLALRSIANLANKAIGYINTIIDAVNTLSDVTGVTFERVGEVAAAQFENKFSNNFNSAWSGFMSRMAERANTDVVGAFSTAFGNAFSTVNQQMDKMFGGMTIPGLDPNGAANVPSFDPSGLDLGGSGEKKGGSRDSDRRGMGQDGLEIYREDDPFFIDRLEQIREQFKTEREILAEEYILNQEVLDNALANKLLSEQEYYELSRKLAEEHQAGLAAIQSERLNNDLAAASSFFGSMASIAQAGGKRMLKVAKAAAAAQAIVDTIRAAVHAMNDPTAITPIQKFANYAAVFAKGMSAVAAIRGVSDGGGGNGGGGGGGGGGKGGGGMASSGGAGGGAGPTTTFSFTLVNDPMGFGEKFARQFIDQLNSTQRNGGQIRGVIA